MFRAIVTNLALVVALSTAHADTPVKVVEDITKMAKDSLTDNQISEAELAKLLDDVDVDGIARFALGKYANRFDVDAYSDYEIVFRTYLKGQLQEHLSRFSGGDLNVIDTTTRGPQTIIETKVTKADGETIDVNWRLRHSAGKWEIIDIEAMNLWLAIEQRAQFIAELDQNNGDADALIRMLKAKAKAKAKAKG